MIIQFVKVKSSLSDTEVERIMKEREPQFEALPGLIQKYYGREEATGEFVGVYLWASRQSVEEYRQSELAKSIAAAYKAEGTPRVELFEVMFQLRE